ncbi:MAG: arsenic-transporting ATPase [Rhodothermaceae bacterium]|nr:MAG: arsenic-transporting ATPase [Rhodothermaceae bacterium]
MNESRKRPRVLLFTGKGGVGKTTCAAATALRAVRHGHRTLVLSADPAHSLADALDRPLGPEPTPVLPGLDAQEVDLYYSMQKYWGNMRELIRLVFKWQGVSDVAAEEMAALPGMGEASAMLWLDQFYHSGTYDLIIVDSAPTGETLTFLTLPQATEWWLTRAFPFQQVALQTLGKAVRKTTGLPLDKGYEELRTLTERLQVIQGILSDPSTSSVRLVVNPERMVIREARRAYTYLQLYGYGVDAVIVNRILPDDVASDPGWERYLTDQRHYLQEIEESFAPLPILRVPHLRHEVFGLPLLESIGETLYGERDPAEVFYTEPTFRVTTEDDAYILHFRLPFADDTPVTTRRTGDRLIVQVGNQRRHYLLPRFLAFYDLRGTILNDGWLEARFVPAAPSSAPEPT